MNKLQYDYLNQDEVKELKSIVKSYNYKDIKIHAVPDKHYNNCLFNVILAIGGSMPDSLKITKNLRVTLSIFANK